jgi:hypothetical protein
MRAKRGLVDLAVAALSTGLIAVGAVGVFETDNGAGVAALLASGTVLLMVVALGERIESLRWGDVELTLRRKADEAAAAGDVRLERELRDAADTLARRAAPVAASYEAVRGSMGSGPERTRAMEAEIARAREDAISGRFDPGELASLFRDGREGQRVYVLGVLQERPELATAELVLDAIRGPRSPFEQYHSLLLAERALGHFSDAERAAVGSAVGRAAESWKFKRDSDRATVAQRILERVR